LALQKERVYYLSEFSVTKKWINQPETIINFDLVCYLVKALCSNCGNEVETAGTSMDGLESYKCVKCGTTGTIQQDRNKPPVSGVRSSSKMYAIPGIQVHLNILGLGLGISSNNLKCQRCGNQISSEYTRCPFCMQQLK